MITLSSLSSQLFISAMTAFTQVNNTRAPGLYAVLSHIELCSTPAVGLILQHLLNNFLPISWVLVSIILPHSSTSFPSTCISHPSSPVTHSKSHSNKMFILFLCSLLPQFFSHSHQAFISPHLQILSRSSMASISPNSNMKSISTLSSTEECLKHQIHRMTQALEPDCWS